MSQLQAADLGEYAAALQARFQDASEDERTLAKRFIHKLALIDQQLLDVDALQDPASGRLLHLYSLVARCLSCETVFKAEEGQGLVSHSASRVVRCPAGCGQQAFKPSLLRAWQPQVAAQA